MAARQFPAIVVAVSVARLALKPLFLLTSLLVVASRTEFLFVLEFVKQDAVNFPSHPAWRSGSAIAESAVNEVLSARMAKGQQMRWCDEGAHHLALVRVADLNGGADCANIWPHHPTATMRFGQVIV
jgi:alkylhydroperoxidase family enzyme